MRRFIFSALLISAGLYFKPYNAFAKAEYFSDAIKEKTVLCLAIDENNPEMIFAGSKRGLYQSQDGARSWKQVLSIQAAEASEVNFILISRLEPKTVLLASENGLYISSDYGLSWQKKKIGLGELNNHLHAIFEDVSAGRIYLGTASGLYLSQDKMKSWEKVSYLNNLPIYYINGNGKEIYVASANGLYRHKKESDEWERVLVSNAAIEAYDESDESSESEEPDDSGEVNKITSIIFNQKEPQAIYISTWKGIFLSHDDGKSWQEFPAEGLLSRKVNQILAVPGTNEVIYAATEKGLFYFAEDKWQEVQIGAISKVKFLARTKSSLYPAGEGGLLRIALNEQSLPLTEKRQGKREKFNSCEPSIGQVREAAIRYAEVHPEKIADWRKRAAMQALLPRVSVDIDHDESNDYEIYTSSTKSFVFEGPDAKSDGWGVSLTWDLGNLIWNSEQTDIDVRSRLMAQLHDDILSEVNRTYFERKRLLLDLKMSPPKEEKAVLEKEIRLEELTAGLDNLTGGYFSRAKAEFQQLP
jgi:photosystem II stability/assembly factor-like uncharacterized protein